MTIAILGATGTAGEATTAAARRAGYDVRGLSRATGVDLHTGAGLDEGLRGIDVVIDASNPFPTADAGLDVVSAFAASTRRLAEACATAKVRHLVHLSICNIHQPAFDGFDYYLAKRAQEEVLGSTPLPHTVIRTTQWMEFALNPAAVAVSDDEVRVQDWLVQPIAVATVAEVLVHATTDQRDRQVAGPDIIHLPDLTRGLLTATGDPRPVVTVEPFVPELARGVLLAPSGAELLGPTPDEWVAGRTA
ncbi:SDR family oxidoreductase [Williamsia sterculiae]|uniref:Uncharacterized conserved protein YbjT, contains NAD(P)-binding and DUF2867 domains n=1 Tax=Williamsia sterculiae TaxID=1344003 RepID=A0A1N7H6P2_9NOCA|nr:NAD(P)H-binding protein [Williamsia sterculiae]SIS20380.1 Uncharacterized conserved protein YbjT, contains NAD(P)-binding and DUF2867 domains [Williamsia sterculiae]